MAVASARPTFAAGSCVASGWKAWPTRARRTVCVRYGAWICWLVMNHSTSITPADERDNEFFATQAKHVRQCLREGTMAVAIWLVALVWCCSVMIVKGYIAPADRPLEPELLLGMPSWVVWGLFVPWIAQIGATWWFAICWLKDDEPYHEFPNGSS